MDNKSVILDKLGVTIKGKDLQLLKYLVLHGESNVFIIREIKDVLLNHTGETERTLFRRLAMLEKEGVLTKSSPGVYRLTKPWIDIFSLEDIKEWGKRKQKAKTQRPTNSRF